MPVPRIGNNDIRTGLINCTAKIGNRINIKNIIRSGYNIILARRDSNCPIQRIIDTKIRL